MATDKTQPGVGRPGEPTPETREGLSRYILQGEFINAKPVFPVSFRGDINVDNQSGALAGLTQDSFGIAVIVGERHEDTLSFTKLYRDYVNPLPISYTFSKDNEGIWVGTYSYREFIGRWNNVEGEARMNESQAPVISGISKADFESAYKKTLDAIAIERATFEAAVERVIERNSRRRVN